MDIVGAHPRVGVGGARESDAGGRAGTHRMMVSLGIQLWEEGRVQGWDCALHAAEALVSIPYGMVRLPNYWRRLSNYFRLDLACYQSIRDASCEPCSPVNTCQHAGQQVAHALYNIRAGGLRRHHLCSRPSGAHHLRSPLCSGAGAKGGELHRLGERRRCRSKEKGCPRCCCSPTKPYPQRASSLEPGPEGCAADGELQCAGSPQVPPAPATSSQQRPRQRHTGVLHTGVHTGTSSQSQSPPLQRHTGVLHTGQQSPPRQRHTVRGGISGVRQ